jgi:hypothetical protein
MKWYVIVRESGQYWTGNRDEYTRELSRAKLFTEEEMDLSFVFPNEAFIPLPTPGDS